MVLKKQLEDLLEFIKNNPQKGVWYADEWETELTSSIPGWLDIVRDPANWPAIEQVQPRGSYHYLCELLLDTVGFELARRWLGSGVQKQADASRRWLEEVENLNAGIWNELTDQMKQYVVNATFKDHPGEPFESLHRLGPDLHRLDREQYFRLPGGVTPFVFPITGYVPSVEISQLRLIVKSAGDAEYLKHIDDMIAQREKACQLPFSQQFAWRIPYALTRDERELIARLMDKARQSGFIPAALPQIFLSFEAPPLFVAYPELEDEEDQEEEGVIEPQVPRNRRRGRPETISIEEVLGCYIPNPQIILYARGLRWYTRRKGLDEELLRTVVIVHEIGHWVIHLLPKRGVPEWPLELYKLTEEDVHEGWAQLITWWVAKEAGGEIEQTFEKLNESQSAPYYVYERFKDKGVRSVMASLERLRQLRWPARIEDWERFIG